MLRGERETRDFFTSFPMKLQKNVLRGALRAGANPIKDTARANIHSISGLTAKGIRVFTGSRDGKVTATIRTTGPHAHVGNWLEFGTAAHAIRPKDGTWLYFGGVFLREVMHPGARPYPFLVPAMDSRRNDVVYAAAKYMESRLTKEGLNVAGVNIGGEE